MVVTRFSATTMVVVVSIGMPVWNNHLPKANGCSILAMLLTREEKHPSRNEFMPNLTYCHNSTAIVINQFI